LKKNMQAQGITTIWTERLLANDTYEAMTFGWK